MDKKRLQLGNIVNVPNWYRDRQDAYFRITSLSEEGNIIEVANGRILTSVSIEDIQPVELTIELMDKIGLERLKGNDFKIIDNVEIWFVSDGAHIAISGISVMRNPIRYLHELQNIHRLLCGTDLDLDLPTRFDGIQSTCPVNRALKKKGLRWNPETGVIEVNRLWRARLGEIYFFINSNGELYPEKELNTKIDDMRWKIGNYFSTENEAQKYANEFKRILKGRALDKEE